MKLTAHRAQVWRARSRSGLALVVLASWFGTLLVAAPTLAQASPPAGPAITASPASPDNDASPTWTFDVGPTTSTTTVDTSTSDTHTVTVTIQHNAKCAIATSTPSSYTACGSSTPASGVLTFASPALTSPGTYR